MDATIKLGGENYVLWGGREGYETLLNTDMGRERQQAGRMLQMVWITNTRWVSKVRS